MIEFNKEKLVRLISKKERKFAEVRIIDQQIRETGDSLRESRMIAHSLKSQAKYKAQFEEVEEFQKTDIEPLERRRKVLLDEKNKLEQKIKPFMIGVVNLENAAKKWGWNGELA